MGMLIKKELKALFYVLKTKNEPMSPKYYTTFAPQCQEINCEQFVNKL